MLPRRPWHSPQPTPCLTRNVQPFIGVGFCEEIGNYRMCLTETQFSEDASYHTLNVCKLFLKTSPRRWMSETRGTLRVRFPHLTCDRPETMEPLFSRCLTAGGRGKTWRGRGVVRGVFFSINLNVLGFRKVRNSNQCLLSVYYMPDLFSVLHKFGHVILTTAFETGALITCFA